MCQKFCVKDFLVCNKPWFIEVKKHWTRKRNECTFFSDICVAISWFLALLSTLKDLLIDDGLSMALEYLNIEEKKSDYKKRGLWKSTVPFSRVLVLNYSPISAIPLIVRCPWNPKFVLNGDPLYKIHLTFAIFTT